MNVGVFACDRACAGMRVCVAGGGVDGAMRSEPVREHSACGLFGALALVRCDSKSNESKEVVRSNCSTNRTNGKRRWRAGAAWLLSLSATLL